MSKFSWIVPDCKCNTTDIEDYVHIAKELRPRDTCEGLHFIKLAVLTIAMNSDSWNRCNILLMIETELKKESHG